MSAFVLKSHNLYGWIRNSFVPSGNCFEKFKESRKLSLAIVFIVFLVDNVLFTAVVPVLPEYLIDLDLNPESNIESNYTTTAIVNRSYEPVHVNDELNNNGQSDEMVNHSYWLQKNILQQENSRIGWLLASKACVQLVVTPFIGPLINRTGTHLPMIIGTFLLLISTLLFAVGESYWVLFLSRSVHGLSTPCTAVAGMSLLANKYKDDHERSTAMGIAMGGMGVGVIIGYPFGGVVCDVLGKTTTFLILAVMVLGVCIIQLITLWPYGTTEICRRDVSILQLLKDPYILVTAGAIMFPEMAMAMLESTIPIWLIGKLHPPNWWLGIIFIPDSIGFWLGCNLFGFVAIKMGRWRCSIAALLLSGISMACIPLITRMSQLIVPHFGFGLSLGVIDATLIPMLALLVDTRHVAGYGSVYAISQVAISIGYALGPVVGGILVRHIGFTNLMRGMALANIIYSPLCILLRNPPTREESMAILSNGNEVGPDSKSTYRTTDFNFHKLSEEE